MKQQQRTALDVASDRRRTDWSDSSATMAASSLARGTYPRARLQPPISAMSRNDSQRTSHASLPQLSPNHQTADARREGQTVSHDEDQRRTRSLPEQRLDGARMTITSLLSPEAARPLAALPYNPRSAVISSSPSVSAATHPWVQRAPTTLSRHLVSGCNTHKQKASHRLDAPPPSLRYDPIMSLRHTPTQCHTRPSGYSTVRRSFSSRHPITELEGPKGGEIRRDSAAMTPDTSVSNARHDTEPSKRIPPLPRLFAERMMPDVPTTAPLPPFSYTLIIRQQPLAARACGYGERDRRAVDPPPIIALEIRDLVTGAPAADSDAYLALHCSLIGVDGDEDEMYLNDTTRDRGGGGSGDGGGEAQSARRLMGTLVASPFEGKDERGAPGRFFVFSDVSCRTVGHYRLRFRLLRIDPRRMRPGCSHASVATIVSDPFDAYTAKTFPGMRSSSPLLRALRAQGLNVGVKKGSDARKRGRRASTSSSSGVGQDDEDGNGDNAADLVGRRASSDWSAKVPGRRTRKRVQG